MATCKECGQEVVIGDWPFCPHGLVHGASARRFDDIVVWQSVSDPDKYSFPGQPNEPVPAGYNKIVISNIRQSDQFTSRFNDLERQKLERERDIRHALDDAGVADRRAEEDARGYIVRADGSKFYVRGNGRAEALQRAARMWADKLRERRRAMHPRIDPHFHNNALSFDSGNRNSYSGQETNWRERKK